jgi:hypothetical protein
MKNLSSTIAVLLVLAAPLSAKAQSQNPNEIPTNLPGTTTIAAPPAGFDVLTASDEQLADYGFPPRPDQGSSPEEYASWAKAMLASKTRIIPNLVQTNIFHGPARATGKSASTDEKTLDFYNWSGYVAVGSAKSYGSSSFYYVESDYVVPVARQAFNACTGGWDYGSSWVGIDGYQSNDVLQAGIEFDAYCSGGTVATFYSPWFEWFPNGEVRITNLPIAPGDDYFVEVWHTSPTQGYAYLVNFNTGQDVEVGFTAPAGTTLIGNTAEWITERPEVGGAFATLTNYIAEIYWNAVAYTEKEKKFDPGDAKAADMFDNNNKKISVPSLLNSESFIVTDEGSAY